MVRLETCLALRGIGAHGDHVGLQVKRPKLDAQGVGERFGRNDHRLARQRAQGGHFGALEAVFGPFNGYGRYRHGRGQHGGGCGQTEGYCEQAHGAKYPIDF